MKILVIDDSYLFFQALRDHLVEQGHEVVEANDGISALNLLAPDGVRDESFDAIVSDCQMPRMSGLSLVQALSEARIFTPFLLHSSSGRFTHNDTTVNLKEVEHLFDFVRFHLKAVDWSFNYVDEFQRGVQ